MFENAAGKLKSILNVFFWIIQFFSVIISCLYAERTNGVSLLIIPIVFAVSWISSLFVMAVLEAMENIYRINKKLKNIEEDADCLHENVLIITKVIERKNPDLLDENRHNERMLRKKEKAYPVQKKQYPSEVDNNEIDIHL